MAKTTLPQELSGRRATSQRKLLLDLIQQADGHLDADELYRQAREREPSISLSTVYRNLRLFKDLGLIEERYLAQDHHLYEPKAAVEHHHLICLGCGKVTEFVTPLTEQMKHEVGLQHGFVITEAEIAMKGYCSQCGRGGAR